MADPPKVRNTGIKSISSELLRSLLSELRSLSFLIEHDDDLLESIYKELNNLIRSVKSAVPEENCLPLLSNKIKKDLSIKALKNIISYQHQKEKE